MQEEPAGAALAGAVLGQDRARGRAGEARQHPAGNVPLNEIKSPDPKGIRLSFFPLHVTYFSRPIAPELP